MIRASVVLPGARRAVEDRRVRLARLDRGAKRRAVGEKVALSHQLLQRARAHPDGEGRIGGRDVARRLRVIGLDRTGDPPWHEYAPGSATHLASDRWNRLRRPGRARSETRPSSSSPSSFASTPSTRPGTSGRRRSTSPKILDDAGFEVELLEQEPDRTNVIARLPGEAEGPILAFITHMDTVPGESRRVELQPLVGRRRRRLRPGPRRPGHEGPGRDRGRRRRSPGALRLAARARRAQGDRRRRRGARRPHGRQVALRGAPREGACRLRRERGRRRSVRGRRAPLLSASRSARRASSASSSRAKRPRGPRLGAEPRRQRAASPRAGHLAPRRAAPARGDARRGSSSSRRRSAARSTSTTPATSSPRWPSFGASPPRPPPTWPSRCFA